MILSWVLVGIVPLVWAGPSSPPGICHVCIDVDVTGIPTYDSSNAEHKAGLDALLETYNPSNASCDSAAASVTCNYGQKCLSVTLGEIPVAAFQGTIDIVSKVCLWDYTYNMVGDDRSQVNMASGAMLCNMASCTGDTGVLTSFDLVNTNATCAVQCTDAQMPTTPAPTTEGPPPKKFKVVLVVGTNFTADLLDTSSEAFTEAATALETAILAGMRSNGVIAVDVLAFRQVEAQTAANRKRRSTMITTAETELSYDGNSDVTASDVEADLATFAASSDQVLAALSVEESFSKRFGVAAMALLVALIGKLL